jgi:hypothetical protein
MLTALILVCSLSSVPSLEACTEENAVIVVRDPETFVSPVTCLMHGQAYLAETAIGRDLSENEAVKVLCIPSRIAAAPSPAATSNRKLCGGNAVAQSKCFGDRSRPNCRRA